MYKNKVCTKLGQAMLTVAGLVFLLPTSLAAHILGVVLSPPTE